MKKKYIYIAGAVTDHLARPQENTDEKEVLSLQWAKGMIGAMPVFNSKEDAEAYSSGRVPVFEMEVRIVDKERKLDNEVKIN